MTRTALIYSLAVFILVIYCSKQIDKPENLVQAPILLSSPPDTLVNERGIDAVPEDDAIRVEWINEDRFVKYTLYRKSEDEEDFSLLANATENDSFIVDQQDIFINKRYYYYLTARDRDGHWSEPSDTVDYMLVAKAYNLAVSFQDKLRFHWNVVEITPDRYILKLFDDKTDSVVWFSRVSSNYQGTEESVDYNWDGRAVTAQLTSGVKYRWRIDIIGPTAHSGSESNWHKFIMP